MLGSSDKSFVPASTRYSRSSLAGPCFSLFPALCRSQRITDHADTLTLVEESGNVHEGRIALRRFSLHEIACLLHLVMDPGMNDQGFQKGICVIEYVRSF